VRLKHRHMRYQFAIGLMIGSIGGISVGGSTIDNQSVATNASASLAAESIRGRRDVVDKEKARQRKTKGRPSRAAKGAKSKAPTSSPTTTNAPSSSPTESLLCVGFYEASDRNEYKACIGPNGKATQFSSGQNRDFNIGTFSDIFLDNSRGGSFTIKWTGGARNFCSKNRSAEATGICAPSNVSRFKSVTEPSGCTYYFEIEEPYFCASSVDEFWEKVRG